MAIPPPHDLSAFLAAKQIAPQLPAIDPSIWLEDEGQTAAFRELQTQKTVSLAGGGVEVIPLTHRILDGESASLSTNHLVTRPEQRKMIDYAFEQSRMNLSKQKYVIAVRGSPGIGKSRSALLYIRRLMQQKNEGCSEANSF